MLLPFSQAGVSRGPAFQTTGTCSATSASSACQTGSSAVMPRTSTAPRTAGACRRRARAAAARSVGRSIPGGRWPRTAASIAARAAKRGCSGVRAARSSPARHALPSVRVRASCSPGRLRIGSRSPRVPDGASRTTVPTAIDNVLSVHATEEPAGKPGGHADNACHLYAMVAVSRRLEASVVRRQAAVDDNGLSLCHGPVTLQLVGTPTRAPSRSKAASKIAGTRLSLIAAAVRATASSCGQGSRRTWARPAKSGCALRPSFLAGIQRATDTSLLVGRRRFTHEPPQAALTLLADDGARLGGVLTGQ